MTWFMPGQTAMKRHIISARQSHYAGSRRPFALAFAFAFVFVEGGYSLAYNVGVRGAGHCTATRRLNAGDIAGGYRCGRRRVLWKAC